jgi:hypothetical protein
MFDKKHKTWILLLGDLLALILFVYIGQRDHETIDPVNPLLGVLILTSEFAIPWLITGWWLGAFNADTQSSKRTFLARSLNTWLVAAPLGILLRALILGRAVIPTAFFIVAVSVGGAGVLGWRLVFAWWWTRQARKFSAKLT